MRIHQPNPILALLLCAVLWSTGGILIKSVTWNPMAIAGIRSLIGAITLCFLTKRAPLFLVRRQDGTPDRAQTAIYLISGVTYSLTMILFVIANKMTTAANAILLQYTNPIYIILLGPIVLGEKNTKLDYLTVAGVFAGMTLFVADGLHGGNVLGNLLSAASGLTFAVTVILLRKQKNPSDAFLLAHLITFVAMIPFYFDPPPLNIPFIGGLLALGIFQIGLASSLYAIGIVRVTAVSASLMTILEPLLSPLWVLLFYREIPSTQAMLGGVVILGFISVRVIGKSTKKNGKLKIKEKIVLLVKEIFSNLLGLFAFGSAIADSVSIIFIAVVLEKTLTRKVNICTSVLVWIACFFAFLVIDFFGYRFAGLVSKSPTGIGDFICISTMVFLLMIPATKLYTEHLSSCIFILELSVLIAIIGVYLTTNLTVFVLNIIQVEVTDDSRFMLNLAILKIPVSIILFLGYRGFIRRPAKAALHAMVGKMGRYLPITLIAIYSFWGFCSLTDFSVGDTIRWILFSGLLCVTSGTIYWLIFSVVKQTSSTFTMEAELRIANNIQQKMLPSTFPAFPDRTEFDLYALMNPAKEIGGDFYDFFFLDDNHLVLVIADVSGKGVPAALFMAIANTTIKNQMSNGLSVELALEQINRQLCRDNRSHLFVSAFIGILDVRTGQFSYANAGHNPPIIRRAGGKLGLLNKEHGVVLACVPDASYNKATAVLKQDDVVFLYTDGVTEAMNRDRNLYSEERLYAALSAAALAKNTPKSLLHAIRADIDVFAGDAEQADDITMLALKLNGLKTNGIDK